MKRYLIYGLSKSGKSALKLIYNKKDFFYLYDYDEQVRLNFEEDLINKANVFLLNEINKKTINFIDEIILSPGVSIYNEHIVYAKKRQIQVTSELELGFRNCKNKLIAIT
ncbi:MAG: hypothetical protein IKA31_00335, partial [Clostridia bacterium]|nr:hypothetical protein [Clostridia bacterium]